MLYLSLPSTLQMMNRRIVKELARLQKDGIPGVTLKIDPQNARYLHLELTGAPETPYEGGVFKLEAFLPEEYPLEPPKIRFLTRLYHPNIDLIGRICLDILKDKWSPALQIRTVLLSLMALLSTPNPEDPLNNEAADLWIRDPEEACRVARDWTQKYASVQPSSD